MTRRRIVVGVLFGGVSAEHEVSWRSARNVVAALDPVRYLAFPILIDRQGRWLRLEQGDLASDPFQPGRGKEIPRSGRAVLLDPTPGGLGVLDRGSGRLLATLDVIFPVVHGTLGEDGTLQGLCEMYRIPFVGPGVLASAVCMDKEIMKRLLREQGIPTPRFLVFRSASVDRRALALVKRDLGFPVFVKPANMGSSVGVRKVRTPAALAGALAHALRFDRKALVEEFVEGREIECSVLGNERPQASIPGEVVPAGRHGFYSYQAKYLDPKGARLLVPAPLPPEVAARVRALAVRSFEALGCEGMARVYFFVKSDGSVLVNELNTIPGFTDISMYPKLWEATGIPCRELVHRLILFAFRRFEREKALSRIHKEKPRPGGARRPKAGRG